LTVTNPYYEFDPGFIPFTKARAGDNNLQFQAIQNAFDLLPSDSDALTTDTATFGPESGSGNAYVVTLADTRTSNQDGDGVRFFATHTNTGPATLNIDAIGALALVNWTGSVLGGGEIVSGRIYEVRFDAANVQYVISASTDGAIQVAFAEEWAIKAEDVPVSTGAGGNGTTDFSSFHWAQKSLLSATTGRVNTDIVTATPPTTEAVTGAFEIYDAIAEDDDLLMRLGFQGSNLLVLRNLMHGGDFQLSVETAAGVEVPYKFSDTRMAIPNAVGVTFDDSGAVERESLILEGSSGGDADFAEVEYLANGDGADAATTFTEQSLNAAIATFVGNAQLDTAQFKFGTASFLFDGTGDYVTFPDIAAYNLGSSVFTVEGWVRFASLPAVGDEMTMVSQWSTSTSTDESFAISLIQDGGSHRIRFEADGVFEQGTIAAPNLNQWYHFAAQRSAGDRLDIWFDGALEFGANVFSGAIQDSTETMKLGVFDPGAGANAGFLDGWLDDVRLTIGVERYTSGGAITVPATAFPTTGVSDAFKVGNTAIQTVILGSGGEAAQTIAAASGGLQVNNTLTGAGLERVLTVGDLIGGTVGRVLTDINTATPPTTEAVSGEFEIFDADETDQLMRLGYVAANELNLHNFMHGGELRLSGEDAAGTVKTFFLADPNSIVDITANTSLRLFIDAGNNAVVCTGGAGVDLYDNNIERFSVTVDGKVIVRSDTDTDAEARQVVFTHQDGTVRAAIGHFTDDTFIIRNEIHNGEIQLIQEDPSGVDVTVFSANAQSGETEINGANVVRLKFDNGEQAFRAQVNSFAQIFHNGIEVFKTTTTALGGVSVTNLLTGSGLERVLTESDSVVLPQLKLKLADESVTSSTTLQDDNDLVGFDLETDAVYIIEGFVSYVQNVGDLKWAFTFTNTPISTYHFGYRAAASDNSVQSDSGVISTVFTTFGLTDANSVGMTIVGSFRANATTGGTMKVQWAQSINSANPTTWRAGTYLKLTKVT